MPQLQFHWYGFLIGLALVVGLYFTEALFKKRNIPTDFYWQLVAFVIVGGIVGSRLWHVATSYQYYVGQWQRAFEVWNGGLSIIGTVVGAAVTFVLYFLLNPKWKKYQLIALDLSVFGLALGQAIGRLGNYVNQELYGTPTQLPWGIFIDEAHRLPGYSLITHYHPLFAYEALLMILFFFLASRLQKTIFKVGTGALFGFYVFYYSWIRFGLDFLRIDKLTYLPLNLGVNQIFLAIVGVLSAFYLFFQLRKGE